MFREMGNKPFQPEAFWDCFFYPVTDVIDSLVIAPYDTALILSTYVTLLANAV